MLTIWFVWQDIKICIDPRVDSSLILFNSFYTIWFTKLTQSFSRLYGKQNWVLRDKSNCYDYCDFVLIAEQLAGLHNVQAPHLHHDLL